MDEADVAVVGAGPAGAVAAHLLAGAGRSVLLLDPRLAGGASLKPGDALSGAALRVLRAGGLPLPSQSTAHRPIGGNISVWGSSDPVYRDFLAEPDGPSWRLDRDLFESDLVGAARAAGASVQAQAVRDVHREVDGWRLQLRNEGQVKARWLIDASGRAALVARRFGARRRRDEGLVAVVGYGRPDRGFTLERSLIETTPQGWWYAALLPDCRPVFMLHTRPAVATRLRMAPDQWQAALNGTEHIARAFPYPKLDSALRCYDACGASLTPMFGEEWIACGDAALSFDPCAGQGIFSALFSGMAAAHAVKAALAGNNTALSAYAARCTDIRQSYRQRIREHYSAERRWPTADFWHGLGDHRDRLSR
jgi:flavin-dependent dehydrogenase